MKIAIIYHNADFDGILSRETCVHWLKELIPDIELELFGWDYGNPTPLVRHQDFDQVYMVDLCIDEIVASVTYDKLIWIDHHVSAINKYANNQIKGYRIDGVAACRLCWQWFLMEWRRSRGMIWLLPDKTQFTDRMVIEPELIRLAGEYDVFDRRDKRAVPLQFGLKAMQDDPKAFALLVSKCFDINDVDEPFLLSTCWKEGAAAQRFVDAQNADLLAKFGHDVKFGELTFLCINNWKFSSDTFKSGLKTHHDAMMGWRHDGNGMCSVSLYGNDDCTHDLSKIAALMGGGGHKRACGFRVDMSVMAAILGGAYADKFPDKEF